MLKSLTLLTVSFANQKTQEKKDDEEEQQMADERPCFGRSESADDNNDEQKVTGIPFKKSGYSVFDYFQRKEGAFPLSFFAHIFLLLMFAMG